MQSSWEETVKRITSMLCFCLIAFLSSANTWDGPNSGPTARTSKHILFISQDSKNGGISTFFRHFKSAAGHLEWTVKYVNSDNDIALIKEFMTGISKDFDAIVLGGISLSDVETQVKQLTENGKIVVGWHSVASPGSSDLLFTNITTHSKDVGKLSVDAAINSSQGKIGFILLNDSRFAIATAKTSAIVENIEKCNRCFLLENIDLKINQANEVMPAIVAELNQKYGKLWTHTIAINDHYFDSVNFPLRNLKRDDINNIAAGDGSFLAFTRINSGLSQQIATIAEPFDIQGWQLVDEINRAFSGQVASNYVAPPILVTKDNLNKVNNQLVVEYDTSHRQAYLSIWLPTK